MVELPSLLWSYRTTHRSATQATPFFLTYGSKTIIPAEIFAPSSRMAAYAVEVNEGERQLDLNLVQERRDAASTWVVSYKHTLGSYYNTRVKPRRFRSENLVLRKNFVSRAEPRVKLAPKWKRSYRVVESSLSGYCKLAYRDGSLVPRTWHAENLRMYYS